MSSLRESLDPPKTQKRTDTWALCNIHVGKWIIIWIGRLKLGKNTTAVQLAEFLTNVHYNIYGCVYVQDQWRVLE